MSKRKSWKTQRNVYAAITRQLASAAEGHTPAPVAPERAAHLANLCLPPNNHDKARMRREAEQERRRAIARAVLAKEQQQ